MLNMFKTRKVATYKATVDMQIEEWADVMGCGLFTPLESILSNCVIVQ